MLDCAGENHGVVVLWALKFRHFTIDGVIWIFTLDGIDGLEWRRLSLNMLFCRHQLRVIDMAVFPFRNKLKLLHRKI
jgi:hypothetical protein